MLRSTRTLLVLAPVVAPFLYPLGLMLFDVGREFEKFGVQSLEWSISYAAQTLFDGWPTSPWFLLTIGIMSGIFLVTLIAVIPVLFLKRTEKPPSGRHCSASRSSSGHHRCGD